MKLVFVSSAASPQIISHLNSVNKRSINYVQQKWDYSFSKALVRILPDDFCGMTVSSVSAFPLYSAELYTPDLSMSDINTVCIGGINIPFFKQIMYMLKLRIRLEKLIRSFNAEEIVIVSNCIQFLSAWPIVSVARKYKVKIATIVPDLPDCDMCSYHGPRLLIKWYKSLNLKYKKSFDGYVCFSELQMTYLNQKSSHMVMEGFCTTEKQITTVEKSPKFTILYAGGVRIEYGIKELVEGFLLADIPNSELLIFGDGNYANDLRELSDPRVKYFGVVDKSVVLEYERAASLLVNPRPTTEAFSYLSFPSKILEYMVSGTPLMTSHLGSIPKEYDDYLLYFDQISSIEIAKKLKDASRDENLSVIGLKAKAFVEKEKNVDVQAKRVVDFLQSLK